MPQYLFEQDKSMPGNPVVNWLTKLRDDGKILPGSEIHYVRMKDLHLDTPVSSPDATTLLLVSPDEPEGDPVWDPVTAMLVQLADRDF